MRGKASHYWKDSWRVTWLVISLPDCCLSRYLSIPFLFYHKHLPLNLMSRTVSTVSSSSSTLLVSTHSSTASSSSSTLRVSTRSESSITFSPSFFHSIINNSFEAYEKRTKKNLVSHPLTEQLQNCNSPDAILFVLQQQVQDINHSKSGNERLTKWLDPTVKVLYAFTKVLGEGVGLVCFNTSFPLRSAHSCLLIWQVFSPAKAIFAGIGILLSVCTRILYTFELAI